jgi:hypothetical protein
MEKAGLIRPSRSPWCAPVHIVKKKDGSIRVTQDYKRLNQLVIKDAYPIPNIYTMLNQLAKAKDFITIDLTHGYYQMQERMTNSKKNTAFAYEFGFFEFNVLPMGITNACQTFQRMMNNVLGELIGVICFVYLDDIIVFSNTYEEHLLHIQMITDKLRAANLKIKIMKCDFFLIK